MVLWKSYSDICLFMYRGCRWFCGSHILTFIYFCTGDVDGSVEAILDMIGTYRSESCALNVVHYGVGQISTTDIEFANTFRGRSSQHLPLLYCCCLWLELICLCQCLVTAGEVYSSRASIHTLGFS